MLVFVQNVVFDLVSVLLNFEVVAGGCDDLYVDEGMFYISKYLLVELFLFLCDVYVVGNIIKLCVYIYIV